MSPSSSLPPAEVQFIEICPLASSKMMAHAIKHPYNPIHGLVVGSFQVVQGSSCTVHVQDVIPICHSHPTKPIIDMALRLCDIHFHSDPKYKQTSRIVGWYTANERSHDENPKHAALKITKELSQYYNNQGDGEKGTAVVGGEMILLSLLSKGIKDILSSSSSSSSSCTDAASNLFKVYGKDTSDWTREYSKTQVTIHTNHKWKLFLDSLLLSSYSYTDTTKRTTIISPFEIYDFEYHLSEQGLNHDDDWITNSSFSKIA